MYIDFDQGDLSVREAQIVDALVIALSLLGLNAPGADERRNFEKIVTLMNQRIPGLNFRLEEGPQTVRPRAPRGAS